MRYRYNPACPCSRCRVHGYMGPAVLITLGVLFLLDQITHVHWLDFGSTWPALLIVIGLVMFLQHSAPASGHIPREYTAMQQGAPGYPPQPGAPAYPPPPGAPTYPVQPPPVVTPPPAPTAGSITEGTTWNNPNNPEVRNG